MVQDVGRVHAELPPEQQARALIVTSASDLEAMHIYGRTFNLPPVASNQNTDWMRFDPSTLAEPAAYIVAAWPDRSVMAVFTGCRVAGRITNRYGVWNENSGERPNIYVCTGTRGGWPQFWETLRAFA
jgi:hypothetical protein